MTACQCGHAIEEHGGDPRYPGSTACTECDCLAFEADKDRGGGPGFKRLRANPDYANMVERTLAEQRRAIEEVAPNVDRLVQNELNRNDKTPTTRDQPQRGYPKPGRKK